MYKFIYLFYPLVLAYIITIIDNTIFTYSIFNQIVAVDFSNNLKLIGYALIITVLISNAYVIMINKTNLLLLANIYFLCSIFTLFSNDIFSMFLGLEMMTISASILIFYQENRSNNNRLAKRYFFTHLIAASLILIGISYVSTLGTGYNLTKLTSILPINYFSKIIYFLTILGFLINVAAFPFSGWLLDIYPNSDNSIFLYLINFTTKINLVLLYKLFAGTVLLKFLGILMLIYSATYICLEVNIKRLFCYLILSNIGISLIAIGVDFSYFCEYLLMDTIYKTLLALLLVTIIEHNDYKLLDQAIEKPWSILLLAWISIIPYLNLGFIDLNACLKHLIVTSLSNNLRAIVFVTNIISLFGILSSKLFFTNIRKTQTSNTTYPPKNIAILFIMVILIMITNIILRKNYPELLCEFFNISTLGTIAILTLLASFIDIKKINTLPLNLDLIYLIYKYPFKYLFYYKAKDRSKIKKDLINKTWLLQKYFNSLHSSKTSLFLVVILLISLVLLIYY